VICGTRLRSLFSGARDGGEYWDSHRTPRGSGSAAESLRLLEKASIVTGAPDLIFILRIELLGSNNGLSHCFPPTLSTYTGTGTRAHDVNHPRLSRSGNKDWASTRKRAWESDTKGLFTSNARSTYCRYSDEKNRLCKGSARRTLSEAREMLTSIILH